MIHFQYPQYRLQFFPFILSLTFLFVPGLLYPDICLFDSSYYGGQAQLILI